MNELQAGFLLRGRYRIIRLLGKGGMGMVYLADDLTLNREAAVKVNFSTGEESAVQFLQEAHLLAALRHPNLPRVTDYFVEEPCQYLVMDYLPGLDLQSWLERDGRQPWQVILPLALQLGDALSYMHSQNPPVIHRDIKPGNIKLRADGSPVLVDFGIAKATDLSQKTSIGARGYTPGFAPPEQAGGGRTGPYSDQYALAATLYTLLTGIRPVDSIKRVLDKEFLPDACSLNTLIPENVSDALERAMSINPEDRFPSVKDFLTGLQDTGYRFDKTQQRIVEPETGRRRWAALALLFSFLVILALAAFFITGGWLKPEPTVSLPDAALSVVEEKTEPTSTTDARLLLPVTDTVNARVETEAPSLLAGGKLLAYSSKGIDDKFWQVWLMETALNKDGKPVAVTNRPLTTGVGDKTRPAWSPDGKYLIYSAPAVNGSLANGLDIWRISITGGDPVDLSNREGDETDAAWSPDGKMICFTAVESKTGKKQLYLMDADGRNIRPIASGYLESQGVWSPDGRTLFFVITSGSANYFALRAADAGYTKVNPFDTNQSHGRLGQVTDPAFSSDGSRVAYTRTKNRDRWIGIVEYQSRGANFSLVTKTGKDYDPTWSPDGRWIAFTSERDGIPQIYIMTAAGLIQNGVSELTASSKDAAWQP